jgi:hypothetical protein
MIFENTFGELVDVLIENDSFHSNGMLYSANAESASHYTKIGEFMAKDVFDILMKEKTGLNDYDSIKVVRIIENFYNGKDSLPVKYHQVYISCLYDGFAVTGSERIEDLPQKVRQIKLEKILG